MLLACLLGFAIGFGREYRNSPAGLRTIMLTALAACAFTIISIEMITDLGADDNRTQLDPIRSVEAVTAGVAFLAAGRIIQGQGSIKGLTTGAAMWLSGAIGLACGAGYLAIALLATVFAIFILVPMNKWEERLPKNDRQ